MNTEKAQLADGRTVKYLPVPIGEGGMKRVFLTADRQFVIGFYKDQDVAADELFIKRLLAVLGPYNPTTASKTGDYFSGLFCWLAGIVISPLLGIMTPVYPANFFFASGRWAGKEKNGKWFSVPKLRKQLPPKERGDLLSYLMVCLQMARAVRKMHMMGSLTRIYPVPMCYWIPLAARQQLLISICSWFLACIHPMFWERLDIWHLRLFPLSTFRSMISTNSYPAIRQTSTPWRY